VDCVNDANCTGGGKSAPLQTVYEEEEEEEEEEKEEEEEEEEEGEGEVA
jgi:hypothetical protein